MSLITSTSVVTVPGSTITSTLTTSPGVSTDSSSSLLPGSSTPLSSTVATTSDAFTTSSTSDGDFTTTSTANPTTAAATTSTQTTASASSDDTVSTSTVPASTGTTIVPIVTSTASDEGPVTVFVTSTSTVAAHKTQVTSSASAGAISSSPSQPATTSGLHGSAKTAVAVAVPIGAVAIIAVLAAFFITRYRRNKAAKEARRAEVEDYGFNPNSGGSTGNGSAGADGAGRSAAFGAGAGAGAGVGAGAAALGAATASRRPEMSQNYANDDYADGYRGWGNTQTVPMDGHANTNRQSIFPGGSPNGQMGYTTGMGLGAVAGGAVAGRNDMDEKQAMVDDDQSSKYSGQQPIEHNATSYPHHQSYIEGDDFYDQQHGSHDPPPILRDNTARRSVSESTTPTRQSLEFANGIHAAF